MKPKTRKKQKKWKKCKGRSMDNIIKSNKTYAAVNLKRFAILVVSTYCRFRCCSFLWLLHSCNVHSLDWDRCYVNSLRGHACRKLHHLLLSNYLPIDHLAPKFVYLYHIFRENFCLTETYPVLWRPSESSPERPRACHSRVCPPLENSATLSPRSCSSVADLSRIET